MDHGMKPCGQCGKPAFVTPCMACQKAERQRLVEAIRVEQSTARALRSAENKARWAAMSPEQRKDWQKGARHV